MTYPGYRPESKPLPAALMETDEHDSIGMTLDDIAGDMQEPQPEAKKN